MSGYPVTNPSLPYTAALEGGVMSNGKMIFIQGFVPYGCNKFEVNLYCGPGEPHNIALHMNPRFAGTNAVIRTHRVSGSYGNEERHGPFPFQEGQNFELILLCENDRYKIAVNGAHCFEFVHRVPKEQVTHLNIEGSVSITSVRQQGGTPSFPQAPAPAPAPGFGGGFAAPPPQPLVNPRLPALMPIPGGLTPGRSVTVTGSPKLNCKRFEVNLQCGGHGSADIALHFNPRVHYGDARHVVVRTHRERGSWGPEERHAANFPFHPGRAFTLQFVCEPTLYRVFVNGQQFCEFYHRIQPPSRADYIQIEGDANITSVQHT